MFQANEHRLKFKKEFLSEFTKNLTFNDQISDASIMTWAKANQLELSRAEIQQCIRELEFEIGEKYQIRLKRLRKEGYVVLEPEAQFNTASREGQNKIVKVLKTTTKRYKAVAQEKLPENVRTELVRRTMAADSLLMITESTLGIKQINHQEVNVLSSAASNIKALEMFKKP